MALIRDMTTVLDIPHEAGQTITIRKLTWRKLAEARKGREQEQREALRQLGAEFVQAIRGGDEAKAKAAEAAPTVDATAPNDPDYQVAQFALGALLEMGIVAWSYTEPVTPAALDLLDERTAQWAGQAILDYTRPPSDAASRKNG